MRWRDPGSPGKRPGTGGPGHLEVHPGHASTRAMKPSAGRPVTPTITRPLTSYMEQRSRAV
jgi:hypothetical protein